MKDTEIQSVVVSAKIANKKYDLVIERAIRVDPITKTEYVMYKKQPWVVIYSKHGLYHISHVAHIR